MGSIPMIRRHVHDFRRLGAARELHAGILLFDAGDTPREDRIVAIR